MKVDLPECWQRELSSVLGTERFAALSAFVDGERTKHAVYPAEEHVFRAFRATPFERVRVVLLGQDPYHGEGQAHGLCFSVPRGIPLPPSLRNIFRELHDDLGIARSEHGDLSAWTERGVLLLNTVLTVREGQAGSHHRRGWEELTDAAICALSGRARGVVFALWGKPAEQKRKLVDESRHRVVTAAHPSPLSAYRGFLGARPFSAIQNALAALGEPGLDFQT